MKTKRIALWSGPRNISTALMYSFAQRSDTKVVDEPLYAHYLSSTPAGEYHPGTPEILRTQSNDWRQVVDEIFYEDGAAPVLFIKNMTHHLTNVERDFLAGLTNVLLIRDPRDMLPSFVKQISQPTIDDVGYKNHLELLNYLEAIGQSVPILDSREVLRHPQKVLTKLCEQIGIEFDPAMLQWPAGARPEDGCWAPDWYASVHRSTGFMPYRPKTTPFPPQLDPLYEECLPYYQQLANRAIRADGE